MTKHNEYDFSQFKGQFDSAMSPDSDFTDRMKQMLERELGEANQQRTPSVIASPSRANQVVPTPGRRTHPLTIAASILAVLAVVVSSVWVLSGTQLEGDYGSAPSGIATLPANTELTPGADVQLSAELYAIGGDEQLVTVANGVVVTRKWVYANGQDAITQLQARESATGQLIWQQDGLDLDSVLVEEDLLIATTIKWETPENPNAAKRSLIAMDIQTGKIKWGIDLGAPDPNLGFNPPVAPIVSNNRVVLAEYNGKIRAWDLRTGTESWSSQFDQADGVPSSTMPLDSSGYASPVFAMTSWRQLIVLVNADGLVQIFDSATGGILDQYYMRSNGNGRFAVGTLELDNLPTGVLVVRSTASLDGIISNISVINPQNQETVWERELTGQPQTQVAEDGSIALNTHVWESHNWIMQLLRNYGYSTFEFRWIDSSSGKDILTTERGKLESPSITLTDGTYACTRSKRSEIICFDRNGTRHLIDIEPQGDLLLVEGILYVPTDEGLFTAKLP